ncbi:glycosyltransferase [Mangrovicoccus sp. HB161399]|uniref:glycosyltransferase n=1 Tax=Mangrovicoccus sp. HB161399 TaxID=2720392 RepID=UPI0015560EAF|nr:glycosyltransferase [Mangrovicoccus sp. HB161399]
MDIVYQTRFSYRGLSGWRAPEASDPALLYDPERLAHRFALFERITLPSLLSQQDGDFRHVVLSGAGMPRPWRLRLRELCLDTLGDGRAAVIFARPGRAARPFKRHMRRSFPRAAPACQVVLDDDDALAAGFTGLLRAEAGAAAAGMAPGSYLYLSFPTGFSLDLRPGRSPALHPRNVPWTNLGLTLLAAPDVRTHPYATSHRMIGRRHPSRLLAEGRPLYLRCVHGRNDSRALLGGRALAGAELGAAMRLFPFLPGLAGGGPAARAPSAAPRQDSALAQAGSAP